jgi:O-antigen ligase
MPEPIPSSRDFELPKLYRHSGLFVIVGLILLYWSQSMYFVAGNTARMGSLALGFGLILCAAWLRSKGHLFRNLPFVIASGAYFLALVLLSVFQEHQIWYDRTQLIFCVVCIFLFWAGYILAREKRQDFVSANQWSLVGVAGIAIVCLLAFLRFVKDISFQGSERGFGETTLNPVGVAYANTCLGLVFVVIAILNKSLIRKGVHLLAACLAFGVVLSSASRGAVIWGACAIVFFLLLNRHRKYLSGKNVLIAVGACMLVVPVCAVLYTTNYAIAERLDILLERFTEMFQSLFGGGQARTDLSLSARQIMWDSYVSTFDQWIIFGEKRYVGYPHNQWVEILVRFGLMGIPLLIISVVLFFRLGWDVLTRKMRPDVEFSLIATLFVFSYLQSMTSLSLQVNRALWLGFGYLLGYYIERSKQRRRT